MIARKSFLVMGTNAIGAILGAITLFFIGRYMSPAAFGMFGFAFSIIGLASVLSELGLDHAHVKRVSEGQDLGRCITAYTVMKISLTVAYTTLVIVGAAAWAKYQGFYEATSLQVIIIVAVYYLFFQLRKIPIQTFNAFTYTAKTQATALVENLVKVPVLIVVAVVFGLLSGRYVPFQPLAETVATLFDLTRVTDEDGALGIGIAHVAGVIASFAMAMWIFYRHKYPWGRFDPDLMKHYMAFAKPIALMSVLGLLSRRVDTLMVGYFWTADDVGFYFASERIITMILILPTAISTLAFPILSRVVSGGRHRDAAEIARGTQRMMTITTVPVVLMALLFPEEGIRIFLSRRFLPAAPVLQLLSLYVLLYATSMVPRTILLAYDRPHINLRIALVVMMANLILNTVMIPSSILGVELLGLKARGAALATLLSQVLALTLITIATKKITGRGLLDRHVARIFAAALITGIIMHFVAPLPLFGGLDRVWELGAVALLTFTIYGLLISLFGELRMRELRTIWSAINPRHMYDYVKDEMQTDPKR